MKHLAVLGAGSWGTALSIALARRFDEVRLWARDAAQASAITTARENNRYLPGFALPPNVAISPDLPRSVERADIVLLALPSPSLRSVIEAMHPYVSERTFFVSATKGIENESLLLMSSVMAESLPAAAMPLIAVLSGPTFAREIAAGEPAAVVIAARELACAAHIQTAFSTAALRFYTSTDVIGVEIGAALKNVIAIGAGVCRGLGLGSNSVAALVTRGLAEITRLAIAMGGRAKTLSGLAGLGDLVLTATGDLSRNRMVGIQLAQGQSLPEVLKRLTMVAEGVETCRAARRLGLKYDVDLPIVNEMYQILYEEKSPRDAIRDLMERPLTAE